MIHYPPLDPANLATIAAPSLWDGAVVYAPTLPGTRLETNQSILGLLRPPPGGRLTTVVNCPWEGSEAAGTFLYWSPYNGDVVTLWDADNSRWIPFQLPQFGIALGTLVTGAAYEVYMFTKIATPSSTNAGTDVVTFGSATGWATGSVVFPILTIGGLTAGSAYFYNAASSTTGTFHTTLADAVAGTNKVDLTASITQSLYGVSLELLAWKNSTCTISNASPAVVTMNSHGLNAINYYDPVSFTTSGGLPTGLAANQIYYAINVTANTFNLTNEPAGATVNTSSAGSGTHTCWQSRKRGTDVTIQDGRHCKSGDKSRLAIGAFRASSTTQTTSVDQYRYLWNRYNQKTLKWAVAVVGSHGYNGGIRFWNADYANASAHIFTGELQHMLGIVQGNTATPAATAGFAISGISLNNPADYNIVYTYLYAPTAYQIGTSLSASGVFIPFTVGSQVICGVESSAGTGTSIFGAIGIKGEFMG